jgi:hypothetical protein
MRNRIENQLDDICQHGAQTDLTIFESLYQLLNLNRFVLVVDMAHFLIEQ